MLVVALFDKIAKRFISTSLVETEEMFVRNSLFAICMDYSIKDVDPYVVGHFDPELGLINPCVPRQFSWECYKFPVTRQAKDKFLTIEQIEEAAKAKKSEFIQQTKNKKKDLERLLIEAKGNLHKLEHSDKKDKKAIEECKLFIKQISNEIKQLKEVA